MNTKSHSVLRPHAHIDITDENGNHQVADMLHCCHCQAGWVVQPGSGRKRGWCAKCGDVTCGNPACEMCVPVEAGLEIEEKRYADLARSVFGTFTPSASGLLVPGK